MHTEYDKHYQTEQLFGEPYPELIAYFKTLKRSNKVLDIGCGQGRDAIAISRIGFKVTGLDNSEIGINQLNSIAKAERLPLRGKVVDLYKFNDYDLFDIILLDSMFHFYAKDAKKETELIEFILNSSKPRALIIFCVPNSKNIIKHLNKAVEKKKIVFEKELVYTFKDKATNYKSKTDYKIVSIEC